MQLPIWNRRTNPFQNGWIWLSIRQRNDHLEIPNPPAPKCKDETMWSNNLSSISVSKSTNNMVKSWRLTFAFVVMQDQQIHICHHQIDKNLMKIINFGKSETQQWKRVIQRFGLQSCASTWTINMAEPWRHNFPRGAIWNQQIQSFDHPKLTATSSKSLISAQTKRKNGNAWFIQIGSQIDRQNPLPTRLYYKHWRLDKNMTTY